MAHNVIEVDAHTTPIVVPDGADSRSNAAEVIQNLTQALANRTNRLNIHAALKDAANTFTQPNVFDALVGLLDNIESNATAAGKGAFVVRGKPSDDAHAGNKYKYIFSANVNAYYINIYSGEVGGGGQLVITLNAVWDVASQSWHKDSTGDAAVALIFDVLGGSCQFCIQHGPGSWTSWAPDDMGIVAGVGVLQTLLVGGNGGFGGDVSATNISASGNITGGGTLSVPGNIDSTGGVITASNGFTSGADYLMGASHRVKYSPMAPEFRRVRITGVSDAHASNVFFDGSKWTTLATAYVISIPILDFANNSEIDAVWLRYEASGADGTVELVRVAIGDWLVTPSGATPTVTSLASATLTTTGSGVKTAIATLGTPEIIDHGSYDYFIRVSGNAGATHTIWGAGLTIKLFSPGID